MSLFAAGCKYRGQCKKPCHNSACQLSCVNHPRHVALVGPLIVGYCAELLAARVWGSGLQFLPLEVKHNLLMFSGGPGAIVGDFKYDVWRSSLPKEHMRREGAPGTAHNAIRRYGKSFLEWPQYISSASKPAGPGPLATCRI